MFRLFRCNTNQAVHQNCKNTTIYITFFERDLVMKKVVTHYIDIYMFV